MDTLKREPTKAEVRLQSWRIIDSQEFAKTVKLRCLFTYLVELKLNAAPPEAFTENALFVDFFAEGRPDAIATFDCHVNRIVAVTMYHLKAKLRRYYERQGSSDPVMIDFIGNQPRASYRDFHSLVA